MYQALHNIEYVYEINTYLDIMFSQDKKIQQYPKKSLGLEFVISQYNMCNVTILYCITLSVRRTLTYSCIHPNAITICNAVDVVQCHIDISEYNSTRRHPYIFYIGTNVSNNLF